MSPNQQISPSQSTKGLEASNPVVISDSDDELEIDHAGDYPRVIFCIIKICDCDFQLKFQKGSSFFFAGRIQQSSHMSLTRQYLCFRKV